MKSGQSSRLGDFSPIPGFTAGENCGTHQGTHQSSVQTEVESGLSGDPEQELTRERVDQMIEDLPQYGHYDWSQFY